jgi:CRP-like cAMP-binding protein
MTDHINSNGQDDERQSLSTAAARQLATTTKSAPQMQGITSRWLLKILPWVNVKGGAYRVNRRLTYVLGDGRVSFTTSGGEVRVIPGELRELAFLRDFENAEVLGALARRFVQHEHNPGDVIVEAGQPADQIVLIAHGKANKLKAGKFDDEMILAVLTDGDHVPSQTLLANEERWEFTIQAVTRCIVLTLSRQAFEEVAGQAAALRAHLDEFGGKQQQAHDKYGQAAVQISAGHIGEPTLPTTFVDYELSPREYELSVAQTVLRIHSRVADLYNEPMNQTEHQLRLTIEELRERQEYEMINNREFGLLHNADLSQRIPTRTGPPTPDDLDELLTRRRNPQFLLAHPRAIAAFARECNRLGLYPQSNDVNGHMIPTWRGIPLLPCSKIPITSNQTTSIIVLRTGEHNEGVIGLHQTGIPDEYEPGLNVRFMGINEKAIISYLVSAYYSVAVMVPDALGVLEDVEIGH